MAPVALLLAFLVSPAAGASLRRADSNAAIRADPATPKAIKEKWDKMDDFLEIMFTMACTWKHGKDVAGLAAEKLKNGDVDGADGYHSYVKKTQGKNIKGMEKACGLIVAGQEKKCRTGCATRWNANAGERNGCDGKCVTVYNNFETSCMKKAEDLEKVYELKNSKASAQKQCYEGHCKEFPMVWMKAEEKDMTTEVETQCKSRCTADNVKAGCQKKWLLEVDMVASSVGVECAEKSGVKKCFDGKKTKASNGYDKCKSTTKATCDTAHKDCNTKGKTDKAPAEAKAFCDDRKKMCQGQADQKCLDENKGALDKAQAECEAEAGEELTSCKSKAMKTKTEAAEKKCIAERGPKCEADCKGKCQVVKMNKCLLMLKSEDDAGKMFCTDFWAMLKSSSEVDPVTGNPIVL